jgi:hypothetical protein
MRKYYEFVGLDKLMITPLDNPTTISSCIEINNQNKESFIYNTVKKRIKKVLHNKHHILRARRDLTNLGFYYYTKTKADKLADKIVKITDKYLTHLELGKLLISSNMSAIILIYKNILFIAVIHLFFDGINSAELMGICFDNHILDYNLIPKYSYYPFITEFKLIPGIIGSLRSLTKRKLSVDSNWKTELLPIQKKYYNNKLCNIKQIKEYLNVQYKFGFSNIIAIIVALYTFENITKNTFNMGILAGFINETRFNNYSCIIINLKRKENWNKISLLDKIHHISKQIDYVNKSYAKTSIELYYLITNKYNFNFYTNDLLDVLVSCLPTTNPWVFNNKPVKVIQTEMYSTSMPLYIGCGTNNDNVLFSINNRSNDINLDINDTLQIDEILTACKLNQSLKSVT